MNRMEETKGLRGRTDIHFNCCQSVLVPFADQCGLSKEAAYQLGAHFGVTGALMALGMAGADNDAALELMRRFRANNQALDCATLLRLASQRGEERKCHCDRMVYEAVELLEEQLEKK